MDFNWTFHLGDFSDATPVIDPHYDDSLWRAVNVPHDFVIEGTFSPEADQNHGFLPVNISWYRHRFTIPVDVPANFKWSITFDGVYRNSSVYLNGHLLGNHVSGYVSFRHNLTADVLAPAGEQNVLVVRVDATFFEGWWYEGGGIYRHVWLDGAEPLHVAPWGVFVRADVTSPITSQLIADALVTINTTVWNLDTAAHRFTLLSTIFSATGRAVGSVRTDALELVAGAATEQVQTVSVSSVSLWDITAPNLYTLVSRLVPENTQHGTASSTSLQPRRAHAHARARRHKHGSSGSSSRSDALEGDEVATTFGVRKLTFDANEGFFLNDQFVKIKGMCNHQDFGGVGVAMPDSLHLFRLRMLKDLGVNALRASHNAQTPSLLDYADELGLLVWNEERLYANISGQNNGAPNANTPAELRDLVLRDRNHPSVFMWSLCNEFSCGDAKTFAPLQSLILALDDTRPVTAAMNHGWSDEGGMAQILDVVGFNYNLDAWAPFHKTHPTVPIIGSESAASPTTRAVYADNATAGWVSAYDVHRQGWGNLDWTFWHAAHPTEYMEGGFVWTGFDYKGEPTPYSWPCINSHFGMIDIVGFPKDTYYYFAAMWRPERAMVHVFPHWTWPDSAVGTALDVWVYTAAPYVELFVNGRSLGVQGVPADQYASWTVKYEPGTLRAVAYTLANTTWAVTESTTAGDPVAVVLTVDEFSAAVLTGDGQDATLITATIVDAEGRLVPIARDLITFTVTGAGTLLGVGNGDPSDHDPDKATYRHAFGGLARAVVQATLMQPSETTRTITVTASAPGLNGGSIDLLVHAPHALALA